ncbi:MAG: BREX-1 system adenine-specific DNA-methyltransferase PglX [Clostridium butyricum]|nr:BREX-1 system adenine-specific DNA-methyltransferase PglX [Clostridium butyricum]MDU5818942.1 BREX-1 system adenine-specific DNA-methyltransferase PglX [Clostridium butyricum]
MDKNKIKSFAVWARRKMIESVTEKAERIGITQDKIEEVEQVQGGFKLGEETFYLSVKHRNALIHEIDEKGFEEVMEEAAYTWFNRFMGLRYMEVNDYLPSGIRILSSSVEGKVEPDVLSKVSEIIEELSLNGEEIYELLDSGTTNDREKAYRIILVKQCNELGKIIPQMFEKISDYTELLLPDNLLEEGSVIRKMVEDIEESDWQEEVEIIGWMYQYYISEKKDEVFAALKKNVKITKENIPAATQLFTPKWIVKYMVENSLGRLWLEGHPNTELQSEWKYYLEEAQQEREVEEELQKIREEHALLTPEDIKVLDPCMGSGHILVYAFDVLYEIYKTAGYSEREIPKLILQNNLYGLDIDDRAAQLASFALIMKARHYNRRLFREIEREHLELNLCAIQESNEITHEVIDYFANGNDELKNDVKYLVDVFTDAKEYGSILEVKAVDFEKIKQRLKEVENEDNLMFGDYRKIILDNLPELVKQGEIMSRLYEVCVTNPPYMGRNGMDDKLLSFSEYNLERSKGDLFAMIMEKVIKYTKRNKFLAMITMHSWMYLPLFKELRKSMFDTKTFNSIVHLGSKAFEEIKGEKVQTVAFQIRINKCEKNRPIFIKLLDYKTPEEKERQFFNKKNKYNYISQQFIINTKDNIPEYEMTKSLEVLKKEDTLAKYHDVKRCLATGNDDLFLRKWYEISIEKTNIFWDREELKWYKVVNGGTFRKWYGNNFDVLNWYNDGNDIKRMHESKQISATLRNLQYFFKNSLTYTYTSMGSGKFNVRYIGENYASLGVGPIIVIDQSVGILGYLNSKVFQYIYNAYCGKTSTFETGKIGSIPYILTNNRSVEENVLLNIQISKNDWDSFEISWDFEVHPLLKSLNKSEEYKLSSVFDIWETESTENFAQLKSNEEELNKIFIDIYGLQDELTPEVEDKDITIRKADRTRDIKSLISYAVGCMFGRYSIDADGLIYAGGEFSDKWLLNDGQCKVRSIEKDEEGNVTNDSWTDASFIPDRENIIPITEDEYFEDDIVSRFIEFIRTVYGEENLEENLDYIADSIGRKTSESARQAIRRYFIKDFYKDHLKIYQKRPIYWMFDSGKNDGFKCLIYMHRYNDQTVAKVRTDYLHTLQRKYEAEINRQQLVVDSSDSTTKDKTVAKKRIDRINKQMEECREYDEVVEYLANEKISIDLDDGVKVNYAKFQDVKVINSKNKEVKMNLLAKI